MTTKSISMRGLEPKNTLLLTSAYYAALGALLAWALHSLFGFHGSDKLWCLPVGVSLLVATYVFSQWCKSATADTSNILMALATGLLGMYVLSRPFVVHPGLALWWLLGTAVCALVFSALSWVLIKTK